MGNCKEERIYSISAISLSLLQELRSIRNLLSRRGLYTENIRKVCNAAVRLGGGLTAALALLLPLLLRRL